MSNLGNKEIIAQNIKFYMDKSSKDRNEICEALQINYSTLSEWVNGNKYPRIDAIEKLANYFGIQKSDLIEPRNNNETTGTLTAEDKDLLVRFHNLNPIAQQTVLNLISSLEQMDKTANEQAAISEVS